jgi:hypothetical protein
MDNYVNQVLDRTDLIENLLNQVIEKYCAPRREVNHFFWHVLLDSSIMPLGSKIKVSMAIAQEVGFKVKSNPLHKVVSLRNAFAHHGISSHPTLVVGKTPEEDEMKYYLQIITQSGKTERKNREEALEEFNSAYTSAKKLLIDLRNKIVSKVAENDN